jgi:hypothetical protein
MTDDQVMRFVLKEHEAGTSQQQIVTKLMQRGVDIQQIRRVKKIAERQKEEAGLGVVQDETMTKASSNIFMIQILFIVYGITNFGAKVRKILRLRL